MRVLRRIPAALVLLLQLVVGTRPLVAVNQPVSGGAAGSHAAASIIPDCHRVESPAELASVPSAGHADAHHVHGASHESAPAVDQTALPSDDTQSPSPSEHGSHHDVGCHGAPCCAPVALGDVIRAVAIRDIPVDRLRPSTGSARIVFTDGARRRPPATAPPVA